MNISDEATPRSKAADAIEAQHRRLVDLVNVDTLNSVLSMTALVTRLRETGMTAREKAEPHTAEALEWAVDRGVDRTLEHLVVSVWAALEVFAEEVWVEMCDLVDLARHKELGQVRIRLVDFAQMSPPDRSRELWEKVPTPASRGGVDRYDYLFRFVGVRPQIKKLGDDWPSLARKGASVNDEWARAMLREVRQVRNVILHGAHVVDRQLAQAAPKRFKIGDSLDLRHEDASDYGIAVLAYADALRYAAFEEIAPERLAE